jgi:hypothetical protein
MTRKRSEKRTEFLVNVLITGVETYGYTPWFQFDKYDPDYGTVTVWHDKDDDGTYTDGPYDIDLDKIASALGKFEKKVMALPEPAKTYAYQMVLANRSNGDDGDYDVTTADAVMQIAVLGEEIYG